jgi:hypothetical protein
LIAGCSLLVACGFDVNVGYTVAPINPDASVPTVIGFGGPGRTPPCDAPELQAYEITVPAAQVPPSCFIGPNDGGTLPELRFGAFVFTPVRAQHDVNRPRAPTLGLRSLPAQQLGDARIIKIPDAIGGEASSFTWSEAVVTRAHPLGPGRKHVSVGGVAFDRLDTLFTGGTLELSSVWSCELAGDAGCEPTLPSDVSCSLARPFTARKVDLPTAWLPAMPPGELADAGSWLISLDLSALADDEVTCSDTLLRLERRESDGVRSLEFWLSNGEALLIPPRLISLGSAPTLAVGPLVSHANTVSIGVTETTRGARETRRGVVAVTDAPGSELNFCSRIAPGNGFANVLVLESAWSCEGPACDRVTSTDLDTCGTALRFEALPLDVRALRSP